MGYLPFPSHLPLKLPQLDDVSPYRLRVQITPEKGLIVLVEVVFRCSVVKCSCGLNRPRTTKQKGCGRTNVAFCPSATGRLSRPLWPAHGTYNAKEKTPSIPEAGDKPSDERNRDVFGFGKTRATSGFVIVTVVKSSSGPKRPSSTTQAVVKNLQYFI